MPHTIEKGKKRKHPSMHVRTGTIHAQTAGLPSSLKTLFSSSKILQIPRHIKSLDTCMKH
jgi:hypothetical protein